MTDSLPSPQDDAEAEPEDTGEITCWCGAHGTYEQLFSGISDGLNARCHGTGMLDCHCGGDLCVCHNHGEVECDGCPDCEDFDDEGYDNDDQY